MYEQPGDDFYRAASLRPEFNVEAVGRDIYRVRNVVAAAAAKIEITVGSRRTGVPRAADGTLSLAPMQSTPPLPVTASRSQIPSSAN